MQASELLNENNLKLLAQLPKEQELFFKWFLAVTQVHRPSHHLEKAFETVKAWGTKLGFTYQEDAGHNVIFTVPATPGKENVPSLVIQGHLDIVAVGTFNPDGSVPVKIENGRLTSGVSTLGADDGIAVAACFALMECEKSFPHGPLEFLITADEEVGLLGASQLAGPPFMKSRSMINLDSEEWGIFYTSCAGGMNIFYEKLLQRQEFQGKHLTLTVNNFVSGHTGLLIHENRQNAVKWLVRILIAARNNGHQFRLCSIEGGKMHNAIPSLATAEVVVSGDAAAFTTFANEYHAKLVKENRVVETKVPKIAVNEAGSAVALTEEDSNKVLNLLETIPHGVYCMSPEIQGMVNTSQSVSVTKMEGDNISIQVFARTNEGNHMDFLINHNKAIAALAGFNVRIPESEVIGPWPPALGSKIMDVAQSTFKSMFNADPVVTGIHAGLECGAIQNRGYDDLEAISFGPLVHGAHTTEENVTIDTAAKCYDLTIEIVKAWAK
ncbi:Clan MH, family M20, peptidase T-like metallopeptidase [Tritrichomonas foetus]|uniref:Clan MH, family M20, peptidase T-like metallopeptidase n=1 Tax=Tritrichomonas foetus TaxID=1144522 RepID=A0A1J4KX61_9EUKA|nr:Clan MH, family M20, peptidase T-like metallopeptidase [Tritrichomonas foetus]|eukprot:OHT14292.1 Clan MH, family M20, peptidase T-like metallopeptidase [Tritrichomonas foetus]